MDVKEKNRVGMIERLIRIAKDKSLLGRSIGRQRWSDNITVEQQW